MQLAVPPDITSDGLARIATVPAPLNYIPQTAFPPGTLIATPHGLVPHIPGIVPQMPLATQPSPHFMLANGQVVPGDGVQPSGMLGLMPVGPPPFGLNMIPPNLLGAGVLQAFPVHFQQPQVPIQMVPPLPQVSSVTSTVSTIKPSIISPVACTTVAPRPSNTATSLSIVGGVPRQTTVSSYSTAGSSLSSRAAMDLKRVTNASELRRISLEEMSKARREVENHIKKNIVLPVSGSSHSSHRNTGHKLSTDKPETMQPDIPLLNKTSHLPTIPVNLPMNLLQQIISGDITVHTVPNRNKSQKSSSGPLQSIAGISTEMGTIPLIPVSGSGGLQLIPIGDASSLKAQNTISSQALPIPAPSSTAHSTSRTTPSLHLASNSLSMMAAQYGGGFTVPRHALINGTSVHPSQLLSSFNKTGKFFIEVFSQGFMNLTSILYIRLV